MNQACHFFNELTNDQKFLKNIFTWLRTDFLRIDPTLLNSRIEDACFSETDSFSSEPPPRIEAARDLASDNPSSMFPSRTGMKRSSRNWSTSDAWLGTRTRRTCEARDGVSEVSDMADDRTPSRRLCTLFALRKRGLPTRRISLLSLIVFNIRNINFCVQFLSNKTFA